MKIVVFDGDERDLQNLCSKTVFVEIKRVLVIFKRKKPLSNTKRLKKSSKN